MIATGDRRGGRLALTAGVAAAFWLMAAAPAMADFQVNDVGDADDFSLADPDCDTTNGGETCTLRAAITQANSTVAHDTITFLPTFNGTLVSSTIAINSMLPAVANPLTINGGDCDPSPTAARPCVGVSAALAGVSFSLSSNIANLGLSGIAFSSAAANSNTAVTIGLGSATIRNSWFGLRVDGSGGPGTCAIGLALDVNGSTVGGTDPQHRNVFSDCATGVQMRGNNNVVQGNYFGTTPGGAIDVNLTSVRAVDLHGYTGSPATGNQIGGADSGTPTVCDGPCNLIAGASTAGVRVGVFGNPDSAANNTAIEGNFVGIGLDGTSDVGNGNGVSIDQGNGTTVGGTPAERNYIGGSDFQSIFARSGATTTDINNNYLGVTVSGTGEVPDGGAVEIGSPSADFLDNRLADRGLLITANNVVIQGNSIGIGVGGADLGFSGTGIIVDGPSGGNAQIGGTAAGEGNEIGNVNHGITTDGSFSDDNVIQGNSIGTSFGGGSEPVLNEGVLIKGDDNIVGGGVADPLIAENTIFSTTDDAIGIVDVGSTGNVVGRNHGSAGPDVGQDLFLDLGDNGPGNPTGVNNSILAPLVTGVMPTLITGFNPHPPGTLFIAYKTPNTDGTDIQSFVGSEIEPSGNQGWVVSGISPPLPTGQCAVVSQFNANGTSEYSTAQAVDGGACVADPTPPPTGTPPANTTPASSPPPSGTTGQRAAALKKCKKKKKKARTNCIKRAKKLPV